MTKPAEGKSRFPATSLQTNLRRFRKDIYRVKYVWAFIKFLQSACALQLLYETILISIY